MSSFRRAAIKAAISTPGSLLQMRKSPISQSGLSTWSNPRLSPELEEETETPQSFVPVDMDRPQSGEFWVNHYAAKAHPRERDDVMVLLALQLRDSAHLNFLQAEPYARMYARAVTRPGDPYEEERAVKTLRSILVAPNHVTRAPAKRRAPLAPSPNEQERGDLNIGVNHQNDLERDCALVSPAGPV